MLILLAWFNMPLQKSIPLVFTEPSGKKTEGVCRCEEYSPAERTKRALGKLGLFWLMAACSVFVPIGHFILVPGFFLTGIILAFMTYPITSVILKGEGTCPGCDALYEIGPAQAKWPLRASCSFCYINFEINPK